MPTKAINVMLVVNHNEELKRFGKGKNTLLLIPPISLSMTRGINKTRGKANDLQKSNQ